MNGEISYDLVMDEDMAFSEGTFRLPGAEWQVLIVSKRDTAEIEIIPQVWGSGVRGLFVEVPKSFRLNKQTVQEILTQRFGIDRWDEVRGPDSMQIR